MHFSHHTIRKITSEIWKEKLYDMRVFMKINSLIHIVVQTEKNMHLRARLEQLCSYYRMRSGAEGPEKVLAAFVIEVLKKMEPILIRLKNEEDVRTIFT